MNQRSQLGRVLTELREKADLNKAELARMAGVDRSYISMIESGKAHIPRRDVLIALARALGVPTEVLLEAAGYIEPSPSSDIAAPRVSGLVGLPGACWRLPSRLLAVGALLRLRCAARGPDVAAAGAGEGWEGVGWLSYLLPALGADTATTAACAMVRHLIYPPYLHLPTVGAPHYLGVVGDVLQRVGLV